MAFLVLAEFPSTSRFLDQETASNGTRELYGGLNGDPPSITPKIICKLKLWIGLIYELYTKVGKFVVFMRHLNDHDTIESPYE